MCGLVGFTGTPLPSVIQAMTDRITHRGPDDQGIWSDDSLSLGHRRLSILDLSSAGHQPMLLPDGRYVLAFNGEIYTHQTIRDELADRVTFRSSSDTETLLYGLIHFGEQLLPRLNGIFAFAFYDTQTHQLLIARDQFGIKPLYYTLAGDRLAFASELKSLLDLPGWSRAIDPKGIANYLTFLWSPGGHTAFESVHKLTAGAYAKFDLSKPVSEVREVSYYRPPFSGKSIKPIGPPNSGDVRHRWDSESHLTDELDQRLQLAVERQLLSDVPVVFFFPAVSTPSCSWLSLARFGPRPSYRPSRSTPPVWRPLKVSSAISTTPGRSPVICGLISKSSTRRATC